MNVAFNGCVARAFDTNDIVPTFIYNGKIRDGVRVEKIFDEKLHFLGKLMNGEYRRFDLNKIQAVACLSI